MRPDGTVESVRLLGPRSVHEAMFLSAVKAWSSAGDEGRQAGALPEDRLDGASSRRDPHSASPTTALADVAHSASWLRTTALVTSLLFLVDHAHLRSDADADRHLVAASRRTRHVGVEARPLGRYLFAHGLRVLLAQSRMDGRSGLLRPLPRGGFALLTLLAAALIAGGWAIAGGCALARSSGKFVWIGLALVCLRRMVGASPARLFPALHPADGPAAGA